MLTGYYKTCYDMYMRATEDIRQQTMEHWTEKHAENKKAGRPDLIMFSAGILQAIFTAEKDIAANKCNDM